MADNRIINLIDEVSTIELQTLINSLTLATDDNTFTDAQKVLWKTLITEAIIPNADNNYQAMSPKSFYNSIMTTIRRGVSRLATPQEIIDKDGDGVIANEDQVGMQAQWKKDWFVGNGEVSVYTIDNEDFALAKAIAYNVVWEGNIGTGQLIALEPEGFSGKAQFKVVYCHIVITINGVFFYPKTLFVASTEFAGIILVPIGITGIDLAMTQYGVSFGIYAASSKSNVIISMTINAIFR